MLNLMEWKEMARGNWRIMQHPMEGTSKHLKKKSRKKITIQSWRCFAKKAFPWKVEKETYGKFH